MFYAMWPRVLGCVGLEPREHWDRGFKSLSRYGCMCDVFLCIWGLLTCRYPAQWVVPNGRKGFIVLNFIRNGEGPDDAIHDSRRRTKYVYTMTVNNLWANQRRWLSPSYESTGPISDISVPLSAQKLLYEIYCKTNSHEQTI